MPLRIVVSGAGIAGLTFAAAIARQQQNNMLLATINNSNRYNNDPTISVLLVDRSDDITRCTIGGGIGLWPPSLAAMSYIGALPALRNEGAPMAGAGYKSMGDGGAAPTLGEPTAQFGERFPVLCLKRDALLRVLVDHVCAAGSGGSCGGGEKKNEMKTIDLRLGVSVQDYERRLGGGVVVALSNGETVEADLLIGADGINSQTRKLMLQKNFFLGDNDDKKHHQKNKSCHEPLDLGYHYYRGVLDLKEDDEAASYRQTSFEAWGTNGRRFGYVPLKYPSVFWFCAVPNAAEGPGAAATAAGRNQTTSPNNNSVGCRTVCDHKCI